MKQQLKEELTLTAIQAAQVAYAPYSRFQVGAALLSKSGVTYQGVNVENASYGLTICAERSAIFSAISDGQRQFELIAVASPGGVAPCGACRQVLHEFAPDIQVLLIDTSGEKQVSELSLGMLLPHAFSGSDKD
ncbi:MAG: cytidine deaminase [Planctomycetaceae bacterium]|nr:cytidine deaminase [Planctomycetaceae bacterium]|tara:strand:- start:886 stop:1287 length:402 start_codon:yes stop_codon:yes gene_type:complete